MMRVLHLNRVLTVFVLATSPCLANDLSGTWLQDNGGMQVKFDRGDDAKCGTIVWIKPGSKTKLKIGQRLFFDIRPADPNSWTAQAMPDGNTVYAGKISVEGSTLTTAGCMAGGLICQSAIWKKVP
jgi:uncharacterized protein (DUF2147 family)